MAVHHQDLVVDWLGYATLRVEHDGFVVYVDPGRYGVLDGSWEPETPGVGHPEPTDYAPEDGDIVCITHDHHYDASGVERVADEDAMVVVYEAVESDRGGRPPDELPYDVHRLGSETTLALGPVEVRTTPAYNHPDGPHTRDDGTPYHPEGTGCGFVLDVDDVCVFWPGDTDVLDIHARLDVSLFCPPIGGSFTMDRHEAASLAETIGPELVLPIHYNTFSALETDSGAFAADVASRGVPVVLDEN